MNAERRIELERALRERGEAGAVRGAAIHNVRLHVGTTEHYGREDWLQIETERYAAWGPRPIADVTAIDAHWGSAAGLIAACWRLGSADEAPRCACLTIAHGGHIAREWQYFDRAALPNLACTTKLPRRAGVPWEYGVVRPAMGQVAPDHHATGIAPPEIAAHPVVEHWHRRWNLREGETADLLFPFESPVMFCERLVAAADGLTVALQWRLVGRLIAPAWGLAPAGDRLELPGLSFFRIEGLRVVGVADYYDVKTLADQAALRAVP